MRSDILMLLVDDVRCCPQWCRRGINDAQSGGAIILDQHTPGWLRSPAIILLFMVGSLGSQMHPLRWKAIGKCLMDNTGRHLHSEPWRFLDQFKCVMHQEGGWQALFYINGAIGPAEAVFTNSKRILYHKGVHTVMCVLAKPELIGKHNIHVGERIQAF